MLDFAFFQPFVELHCLSADKGVGGTCRLQVALTHRGFGAGRQNGVGAAANAGESTPARPRWIGVETGAGAGLQSGSR
jgi:hypothetical protein